MVGRLKKVALASNVGFAVLGRLNLLPGLTIRLRVRLDRIQSGCFSTSHCRVRRIGLSNRNPYDFD